MSSYLNQLATQFPKLKFIINEPLFLHTPVKIGGLAEIFWPTTNSDELIEVFRFCLKQHIPHAVIGWGANTLFSDRGLKGLVIKNKLNTIDLNHSRFNYDNQSILVQIASGTPLPYTINQLLAQNIVGLEFWARIPATINVIGAP